MTCEVILLFDGVPPIPLNTGVDENTNLRDIAEYIASLPKKDRDILAEQFSSAKYHTLSKTDLENHRFVSNTSISELKSKYPEIGELFKDLDIPMDARFTIILSNKFTINGLNYFGRLLDSNGNELFVIRGFYGAMHMFKYLDTKFKLQKLDSKDFDIPELKQLTKHFKEKSELDLILNFLNLRSNYKPFRNENGELIIPSDIIYSFINKHVDYYSSYIGSLSASLENKSNNTFKLSSFLKILQEHNPNLDIVNLEKLVESDIEQFKELIHNELLKDPKWSKARLVSIHGGLTKIVEAKDGYLTQAEIKKLWSKLRKGNSEIPSFDKASLELKQELLQQELFSNGWTDEFGKHYQDLTINIENGKLKIKYTIPATTKKSDLIIQFDFPYDVYLDDVYDCGYDTKSLFKLEEEYNGGYIYKYFKNNVQHYVVTRHIISPNAHAWNYSTIEQARQKIDRMNLQESILENGLYSIRYKKEYSRQAVLELQDVLVGQTITINDIQLPNIKNVENLPEFYKSLMLGSVLNLQQVFYEYDSIKYIDSPQKAAAFILLHYQNELNGNPKTVLELIDTIRESPIINFRVDKILGKRGSNTYVLLKQLLHNGNELQDSGMFKDEKPANINVLAQMDEAIKYFRKTLNIDIESLSISELQEYSDKNSLNLRVNTTKAFVHNGKIIINASKADLSDLFHEISHIFIGVLKVRYPEAFLQLILKYLLHKRFGSYFGNIDKLYKNFSMLDKLEETIAELIAIDLFSKKSLFEIFDGQEFIQEFDKILQDLNNTLNNLVSNGLGFTTFIQESMKDLKDINKSRKLSLLVLKLIEKKQIKEFDCK